MKKLNDFFEKHFIPFAAETYLQFGRLTLQRDRFGDQQVRVRIEARSGRLLRCACDDFHVGNIRIVGRNPCRGGINRVINERSVRILRERYGEFRRAVAYRTFLRVGVCGFGGGRFEHLKVFAGFVPRDFPIATIIQTGVSSKMAIEQDIISKALLIKRFKLYILIVLECECMEDIIKYFTFLNYFYLLATNIKYREVRQNEWWFHYE